MDSDTPILHHYTPSPYSEKVRKMLAFKGMAWRSVQIPPVMPKPDLTALTGGYRKTPVLQMGRDIYCDTKLIARLLDRLQPDPPLVPEGQQAATLMIERWVDQTFFFKAVALFFQPQGLSGLAAVMPPGFLDAFLADRAAMFAQGGTQPAPTLEAARAELPGILAAIEAQLAAAPFLGGARPAQIDFAVYTPVWFVLGNSGISGELGPYPALRAWAARILELGDGRRSELDAAGALAHCRACQVEQAPLPGMPLALPQAGLGDRVRIGASDYAPDLVEGELVIAGAQELAIRRRDERAGTVVVHFPPEGFSLQRC